MSAQLHADFVDVSIDNELARPNMLTVRGRAEWTCPRSKPTPTWSPASPTT